MSGKTLKVITTSFEAQTFLFFLLVLLRFLIHLSSQRPLAVSSCFLHGPIHAGFHLMGDKHTHYRCCLFQNRIALCIKELNKQQKPACNISMDHLYQFILLFLKNIETSTEDQLSFDIIPRLRTIGTLRSDDADGNENVTKAIALITKTTTLHVHHTFLYISLPSLHDYDVKIPYFMLHRGSTKVTMKFPPSF